MHTFTLPVGPYAANCHLVWDDEGVALVVDPGAEAPRIAEALRARNLHLAAVLLTHGHADHMSALADLLAAHPAPWHMHAADAAWAFTEANEFPPYRVPREAPRGFVAADEGSVVEAGSLRATALHTPGHTPGGLCWRVDDMRMQNPPPSTRGVAAEPIQSTLPPSTRGVAAEPIQSTLPPSMRGVAAEPPGGVLLAGDTLFAGSIGRTDFPGGDIAAMGRSLRRLCELPPELRVLAGHGPDTDIGTEIRYNPFLQD